MSRFTWSAVLLTVLAGVLIVAAPADSPPYPARIDFPSTQFDATGAAIPGTGYSPEGIAVHGDTFYAGSTATGEIIKGNLKTGAYDRNWVSASPNQPSDLHRGGLGLLVDDHNRLWFAGSYGMACGGPGQAVCPAPVPAGMRVFNYGVAFVYDATTGAQLAQYTLSTAQAKTINDMTIANNAVWFSNTTAPSGAGSEVQFKLQLGPGGALPPGDVPPPAPAVGTVNPAVTAVPTPGFTGADGIDTLPNGNIILNSVAGTSNGQMIVINTTTGAVTPVTVAAGATCYSGQCAPPLLSGDGVTLDGDMLYYPENRADTATPPGDWAAVHLDPPDYTHAEIVARLNSPPGTGLPPLRSPANMEELGHYVYGITRVLLPNPVTGTVNVTQTFIEHLDKVPLTAAGTAVSAVEGKAFTGPVASVSDPNNGHAAADYRATINWGDGTPASAATVTGSAGSFTIAGGHTYADEGTHSVTTTVTDTITGQTLGTATSTATVADAPLTAGPITESCVSGSCTVTFRFTDGNPGATAADFTASITWGDGSTSAGVISAGGGGFVVTGSHAYADDGGGHAITIKVTDKGGSTVSATTPATTGMLLANANGFGKGGAQSAKFTVVATCSSGTATALLNGVLVHDGEVVRLKNGDGTIVKKDGGHWSITAPSFQLVVNCADATGSQGSTATSVDFASPGDHGKGHH